MAVSVSNTHSQTVHTVSGIPAEDVDRVTQGWQQHSISNLSGLFPIWISFRTWKRHLLVDGSQLHKTGNGIDRNFLSI